MNATYSEMATAKITFKRKPTFNIVFNFICPLEKAIALGGVATGNIKDIEEAKHKAITTSTMGYFKTDSKLVAQGTKIAARAVFDINSVNKTLLVTKDISSIKGGAPSSDCKLSLSQSTHPADCNPLDKAKPPANKKSVDQGRASICWVEIKVDCPEFLEKLGSIQSNKAPAIATFESFIFNELHSLN
jgi:hypothetical protein